MDEPTPRAFEAYIGSFDGPSYGVCWDGTGLVYESFLSGYEQRREALLVPSRAQWLRFWRTMERIGIWSWRNRYDPGERFGPPGLVLDSTHWSLTLAHGALSIESSGAGDGPGSVDRDESGAFTSFVEAVSRLIGGRPFG